LLSTTGPARRSGDCRERVDRAIDHVVQNRERPLHLADVAAVAGLSPFHFHRVFRSMVGEPLGRFVKRLRLERALHRMAHSPRRSLTEIAAESGFASPSDFSRSFKQQYGRPPSRFDVAAWRDERRCSLEASMAAEGHRLTPRLDAGANPDGFAVTIRRLPSRTLAYVRVLDPYRRDAVPEAARRLVGWAEARGLAGGRWYGYQWEDPELVELEKCRYDVAVEVPGGCPAGEVGRLDLPAMQVAELEVRGDIDLEMRALDWLYGTWLPASGRVPADQPCFEAWHGRPFAHGPAHFELSLQLPVEAT